MWVDVHSTSSAMVVVHGSSVTEVGVQRFRRGTWRIRSGVEVHVDGRRGTWRFRVVELDDVSVRHLANQNKAARPTGQPARRGPMQGQAEQAAMATDLAGRGRTGAGDVGSWFEAE